MSMHVNASDRFQDHYRIIEEWDFEFLDRYIATKGLSVPDPGKGLREYRRFMGLMSSSTDACVPSRAIDEIWHAHILHSQDYLSFSRALGRAYLHHHPAEAGESGMLALEYRATLDRYREAFGESPYPVFWSGDVAAAAECSDDHPGHDCRGTCKHNCKAEA